MIWQNTQKMQLQFLCTAKLNQDCTENLFSVIRGKGGHRYNPTSQKFTSALRSASVAKLSSAEGGNCLEDASIPLLATAPTKAVSGLNSHTDPAATASPHFTDVRPEDSGDIPEHIIASDCVKEEALTYIAGWLLHSLKTSPVVSSCSQCESLLVCMREGDHTYVSENTSFIKRKRYTPDSGLMQPSSIFQKIVRRMEVVITEGLAICWTKPKITRTVREKVEGADIFCDFKKIHHEHADNIMNTVIPKLIMCLLGAEMKQRKNRLINLQNKNA
ncbi:hypothetical protein ACEWY4_010430 [Coilia grayii]|uniref:Transposable element P transposase-like RNase H C-terminal domain-containing protein n=1 Tax=Coilia grayii TaxID=363190 RepID=A0ABD1K1X4_9TELE